MCMNKFKFKWVPGQPKGLPPYTVETTDTLILINT